MSERSIFLRVGMARVLQVRQGEAQILSSIRIWMTRIVTMMTRIVSMVTALAVSVPVLCSGQDSLAPTRLEVNRAELTRLLDQYDAIVQSTAYSDVLRDEGRARADIIRNRLSIGDFRRGDQIALFIGEGSAVQWDTLIVEAGPLIDVPTVGPILLHGVLRSELETHLGKELGRFFQLPRVQAHALIRVSVVGLGQPGFYVMPADLLLSEAVMLAGGPGGTDPGLIQIERGPDVIWSFEDLRVPLAEGRTLDDLGLQAGDRIVLPPANTSVAESPVFEQLIRNVPWLLMSALLGFTIR